MYANGGSYPNNYTLGNTPFTSTYAQGNYPDLQGGVQSTTYTAVQPQQQNVHYPAVQSLAAPQQQATVAPVPHTSIVGHPYSQQPYPQQYQQPYPQQEPHPQHQQQHASQPYPCMVPQQQQQQQPAHSPASQPYPSLLVASSLEGRQQQQVQAALTDGMGRMSLQHGKSFDSSSYSQQHDTSFNSSSYPQQPYQEQPASVPPSPAAHYPSFATNGTGSQQHSPPPPQHYPSLDSHSSRYASSSGGGARPYSSYDSIGSGSSFNSSAAMSGKFERYPSAKVAELQQPQEPLPRYPEVPKALPVMPYTVSPDKVPQGYDVMIYIQQAKSLPAMDWWNGLADPYVIVTTQAGGNQVTYRTAHKRNTLNPVFTDEFFEMGNLPVGATFFIEMWDKDMVTDDDVIGRASWSFSPKEMSSEASAGGGLLAADSSWGRTTVKLPLRHPSKAKKDAGELELEVCYRPSTRVRAPCMLGPARFRQHLSPTAGVLTGHWADPESMSFSTYKLFLCNISSVFKDARQPWNKKYDKARQIFKNPLVLSTVCTQHRTLYSTHLGGNRGGTLSSAADLFELFKNGMRGGQRRFFTYTLCEDSMRCSETGAAFFNDMLSKHAMHSGGAEEVLYAGEFCIVPCEGAAGGHKLVIDNNSGTYAPKTSDLHLMKELFESNFQDMTVEVVPVGDPKLEYYQSCCPSRSGAAAAPAGAATASTAAN